MSHSSSLLARLLDEEIESQRNNRAGEILTRKQQSEYSLTRVLRDLGTHKRVGRGIESEISDSTDKLHDGYCRAGHFLPFDVGLGAGRGLARDLQVGQFGAGGALVPTDLDDAVTPLFRNRVTVLRLGSQVISGLRGNFILPRQTSPSTPQSLGEIQPVASSQPTFDQITLAPKRISARVTFSRQLVLQSSVGVESFLRKELFDQISVYLDSMLLNGQGAGSQILGIMQTPGISATTFGGTASWQSVLEFEQALASQNADIPGAKMAFVSTPATRIRWKAVAKVGVNTTSVVPIFLLDPYNWGDDSGDMLCDGYRFASTNNMPNNQVLFGNFDDLVVAFWGNGLDLISDPFTSAASDEINLTAILYADVAARHPQSFCVSTDAGNQ
jgi:HK97 family phage major capsid protein